MHAQLDNINLWYDDHNPTGASAILLIAGTGTSGRWWPEQFVDALVSRGHRVIRFDPRDCGLSDPSPTDDYDLATLADDAAALLRALGIGQAHVVGHSLGGAVSDLLALRHPALVRSLTLVSALARPGHGLDLRAVPTWDSDDMDANHAFLISSLGEHDDTDERDLVASIADEHGPRMTNHAVARHQLAGLRTMPPSDDEVLATGIPAVLVHGDRDTLVPLSNAQAEHRNLGRPLRVLPGVGHLFTRSQWTTLATAVLEHVAAAEETVAAAYPVDHQTQEADSRAVGTDHAPDALPSVVADLPGFTGTS